MKNWNKETLFEQVALIRRRVVFVLTVYKTLDFLISLYKEYRELTSTDPKRNPKLSMIKKLIVNLFAILFIINEEGFSFKLVNPFTKLMLTVNTMRNSKWQMAKSFKFLSSILDKVTPWAKI